jgi:hypothetical protein
VNIEILQLKNNLAERKQRLKNLDIKVSGLITLVRNYLNPYEDDVTQLESEKALNEMADLHNIIQEMKELKIKIHKMEKDLGL